MLPPFLAGQYLALYLEVDGICTSRPYSISSPPNQIGYYDITVKRVPNGLVSNFLLDRIINVQFLSKVVPGSAHRQRSRSWYPWRNMGSSPPPYVDRVNAACAA
jgi:hypothetical protein